MTDQKPDWTHCKHILQCNEKDTAALHILFPDNVLLSTYILPICTLLLIWLSYHSMCSTVLFWLPFFHMIVLFDKVLRNSVSCKFFMPLLFLLVLLATMCKPLYNCNSPSENYFYVWNMRKKGSFNQLDQIIQYRCGTSCIWEICISKNYEVVELYRTKILVKL